MSFIKYINRLIRIDDLIRRKATGTPEKFANSLGLCRSALMEYLKEMKELGAPIAYCKRRQSYYYEENKQLFIGFTDYRISDKQQRGIEGGKDFFYNKFYWSNYNGSVQSTLQEYYVNGH